MASVPAGRHGGGEAEPDVRRRHHVRRAAEGLPVTGGDPGLVSRYLLSEALWATLDASVCAWALEGDANPRQALSLSP